MPKMSWATVAQRHGNPQKNALNWMSALTVSYGFSCDSRCYAMGGVFLRNPKYRFDSCRARQLPFGSGLPLRVALPYGALQVIAAKILRKWQVSSVGI
jgi:hypothetical protein